MCSVLLLILATAVPGCDTRPPDPATLVTTSDSAGIRIVTNRWPGERWLPRWTLDTVPELSIGDPALTPDHELHNVVMPRLASDGRIAVIQNESAILVFGSDGAFQRRLGRQGEGPGEFRGVWMGFPIADSAYAALVGVPHRIVLYDLDTGDVLAEGPRGDEGARASYQFPLSDGRLAGAFRGLEGALSLGWIPPSGGQPVLFGTIPIPPNRWSEEGYPPGDLRPVPANYAAGMQVWAGWGEAYELHVFDPDAGLTGIVRAEFPRAGVSARLADSLEAAHAALWGDVRPTPGVEGVGPRPLAIPDSFPAFDLLLASDEGTVWVRRPQLRSDSRPHRWDVFAPDGRFVARIEVPRRFYPYQVTETHLLGVWTGDYDVQSVRLLRIVKSQPPLAPTPQ